MRARPEARTQGPNLSAGSRQSQTWRRAAVTTTGLCLSARGRPPGEDGSVEVRASPGLHGDRDAAAKGPQYAAHQRDPRLPLHADHGGPGVRGTSARGDAPARKSTRNRLETEVFFRCRGNPSGSQGYARAEAVPIERLLIDGVGGGQWRGVSGVQQVDPAEV